MKIIRPIFALLIGASIVTVAAAQTPPADTEALRTLQKELVSSIDTMKACIPVYEGHYGRARQSMHQAERIINDVINPPAPKEAAPVAAVKVEKKAAAEKKPAAAAPVAAKPAAKAAEGAKPVPAKVYTEEEIATSQVQMQKGFEILQQAIKDFKAATASLPADKAEKVEKLLKTAEDETTKALAVHAKKA